MNGITRNDAQGLQAVLAQGTVSKVKPLFQAVRDHIAPRLLQWGYKFDRGKERAVEGGRREKMFDPWTDGQGLTVWDWCYFTDAKTKRETKWYISWGLTGKAKQFFEDPTAPDSLLAFVYAGTESGVIPLREMASDHRRALADTGWILSNERGDCRRTVDAMTLFAKPGGFTQAFVEWLKEPLEQSNEILVKSYAHFKAPR